MNPTPVLPIRLARGHMKRGVFPARAVETPLQNRQHTLEGQDELSSAVGQMALPPETIDLNARRRAFGEEEYEAFRQRHSPEDKARKPSFLTPTTPTMKDLYDGILYPFGFLPEGKQKTDELEFETER